MAIIDPDGLFAGERLAACSDIAQLYWPRLFLAANTCGRLELSYKSIVSRIFANFHKIPEPLGIWQIFKEYEANFLAVLYQTDSGIWWCEFATSEKFLPKYKKRRDELSPAPSSELMEKHRQGYIAWKKSKSFNNEQFQKFPENSTRGGVGIGVGIGVVPSNEGTKEPSPEPRERSPEAQKKQAKKKKASPPTKTDFATTRHTEFKVAIFLYWKSKNPEIDCPWQQPEGMQLELWLKSSPNTTIAQFKKMLRNRYRSEVTHSERPSVWIKNITSFANGPLNEYGKPLKGGNRGTVAGNKEALRSAASDLIGQLVTVNDHGEINGDDLFPGGESGRRLLEVDEPATIEGKR